MNSEDKLVGIIEAILFIYGDPLTAIEIRDIIDENIDLRLIKSALRELEKEYQNSRRGLILIRLEDKYQVGTKPDFVEYVERVVTPQKKKTLTTAALETLTIIAYKQPVTKLEVEDIRGVKSDAVFTTLINNDLIVVSGVSNKIGRPKLYKTTDTFLKLLGISSLSELPDLEKFKNEQLNLLDDIK